MKDIAGLKYGKLTVAKCVGKNEVGRKKWLCACECGNSGIYYKNQLDSGKRTHCGCEANTKPNLSHGLSNHELYGVWNAMINRCHNRRNKSYPDYGGRGIVVCERWHEIANFIADMHPRPAGHSLDRIDVDGNYEPGNVRWASSKTQRRNQRTPCLTFNNGMSVEDLARLQGIKPATIRMRVHRGWTEEEISNGKRSSADA